MRSISTSIVVFSGSMILASGAWITHSDTSVGIMLIGAVIGLIGLGAWLRELAKPE